MTRWLTSGPTGEPPAWRYFEPPPSWPKWAHRLACTSCRARGARELPERLRWRVAYLLDHLPGQCWSNLVDWALTDRKARRKLGKPWWPRRMDGMCRSDAALNGACYCGRLKDPAGGKCEACAAGSCGRADCGPMGDGSRCACPCGTPEHGAVTT